jgi:sulfite exporter TauE/SafE
MISALAGFLAGFVHVLSGPDHLSAVAPLAVTQKRQPWAAGLRWGIGHASGVLLIGILTLLFRQFIPVKEISSWSERLVGVVLIAIGFWALRKAFSKKLHTHQHAHGAETHMHIHFHGAKKEHEHPRAHAHSHAAFGIGALHGLAGSSHFLGVLPALAFPNITMAVAYLVAFGLGTILAMAGFSLAMGWVGKTFSFNSVKAYRVLLCSTGISASLVGCCWLVQ